MKTLLLIPSVLKTDLTPAVAAGRHPKMDYDALREALASEPNGEVDIVDYAAMERTRHPLIRMVCKAAGRDAALALHGFLRRGHYDAIFTNGENVGIPLALLLKTARKRPGHVTIGHRLSAAKKRVFFTRLGVQRQMDTIFVYATTQRDHATDSLGIPAEKVALIRFHADPGFYHPLPEVAVNTDRICSAGLEWRDYPTLIAATADLLALEVKLAAASPWSKHADETARRVLPSHIEARRYEYSALRELYASSNSVIVPLYENDFQAGVTTLLEAMAMGKAVIITRTTGQTDVVIDGDNGLTVAPGDVEGLMQAILRLQNDVPLRDSLGRRAQQWVHDNATLSHWVHHVITALRDSCTGAPSSAVPR
jgi:glycosyltransferase involved in cell wall biosynthesis